LKYIETHVDHNPFQATKDESHLHMAWEQDYHMQDPGRLALFDEYLEMSEYLMILSFNMIFIYI